MRVTIAPIGQPNSSPPASIPVLLQGRVDKASIVSRIARPPRRAQQGHTTRVNMEQVARRALCARQEAIVRSERRQPHQALVPRDTTAMVAQQQRRPIQRRKVVANASRVTIVRRVRLMDRRHVRRVRIKINLVRHRVTIVPRDSIAMGQQGASQTRSAPQDTTALQEHRPAPSIRALLAPSIISSSASTAPRVCRVRRDPTVRLLALPTPLVLAMGATIVMRDRKLLNNTRALPVPIALLEPRRPNHAPRDSPA